MFDEPFRARSGAVLFGDSNLGPRSSSTPTYVYARLAFQGGSHTWPAKGGWPKAFGELVGYLVTAKPGPSGSAAQGLNGLSGCSARFRGLTGAEVLICYAFKQHHFGFRLEG